jgi:hypothetical protein
VGIRTGNDSVRFSQNLLWRYHDRDFKIELFETPFTGFSNKSMNIRKILNIPAFSGYIWYPHLSRCSRIDWANLIAVHSIHLSLYRGLKRIDVSSERGVEGCDYVITTRKIRVEMWQ